MARHDDDVRWLHMLDHAVEAVEMAQDKTRGDLDTDCRLNLSLVRLLIVWVIVHDDLPGLITQIRHVLEQTGPSGKADP